MRYFFAIYLLFASASVSFATGYEPYFVLPSSPYFSYPPTLPCWPGGKGTCTPVSNIYTASTGDVLTDIYYSHINQSLLAANQASLSYLTTTKFSNISSQISRLDSKVAQMDPTVITQSISFLIGAFVSIAFVLASKHQ